MRWVRRCARSIASWRTCGPRVAGKPERGLASSAAHGADAMAEISRIASGAPWEPIFGYSRAVEAGGWLAVSGTTGFDENGLIVGRNQMYVQARQDIANIAMGVERAGMTLAEVVRTRVFVTDIERFGEVARAHLEAF